MMQQSARALQQEDGHNIWQSTRALQQIDGRNIWQSTRACSPRPECSGMPFDASLSVIVTGFENSGTTVLSQLIMSSPHIFGAFECGLLLACSPREFTRVQPFHNWLPQLWRLPGGMRRRRLTRLRATSMRTAGWRNVIAGQDASIRLCSRRSHA